MPGLWSSLSAVISESVLRCRTSTTSINHSLILPTGDIQWIIPLIISWRWTSTGGVSHGGEHPLAVNHLDGVPYWRSALLTVYPIDGLPYWRSALLTVYPIMYTTFGSQCQVFLWFVLSVYAHWRSFNNQLLFLVATKSEWRKWRLLLLIL